MAKFFKDWQKKRLIKKLKNKYFKGSDFVGPFEKELIPQAVLEEQFLWSKKEFFKGTVLDMSTPKHWHEYIHNLPTVEKILISNLDNEVIEKMGKSSKVDVIGDFCDRENPPMPDNSVDTVLCISILVHCVNPADMVINLKNIVRPGGIILFLTPFAYIDGHMYPDYWRIGKDGYELMARQADLEVVETGEIVDMGKYTKFEFGNSCEANSWHRGIPFNNWMIARKKAE